MVAGTVLSAFTCVSLNIPHNILEIGTTVIPSLYLRRLRLPEAKERPRINGQWGADLVLSTGCMSADSDMLLSLGCLSREQCHRLDAFFFYFLFLFYFLLLSAEVFLFFF